MTVLDHERLGTALALRTEAANDRRACQFSPPWNHNRWFTQWHRPDTSPLQMARYQADAFHDDQPTLNHQTKVVRLPRAERSEHILTTMFWCLRGLESKRGEWDGHSLR
jgi:hypothetical protein